VCRACEDIDAGRFGDVLEVDAATNTRVEEMRDLLDNAQYLPVVGRYKVYIIDEVHMLSRNAFNAMLKTLEEPPEHVKFILATTDPQKVPVTVLSRCLQFGLKPMTTEQLVSRLSLILGEEQVPADEEALKLIAKAARGSVRDSLSVLDQAIAFGAGEVRAAAVASLLGSVSEEAVVALADALVARDGATLIKELNGLLNTGQAAEMILQDFAQLMQSVALSQVTGSASEHPELVSGLSPIQVQLAYQIAISGRKELHLAPDEIAGVTMTFIRMLAFMEEAGPIGGQKVEKAPEAPVPERRAPVTTRVVAHEPPVVKGSLPRSSQEWAALVDRLPKAGAALELARHAVFQELSGHTLVLGLPPIHKSLLTMKDRLSQLLGPLVGPVTLKIALMESREVIPTSVAERDRKDDLAKKGQAAATLDADPVLQALLADGGKIVPDSIRYQDVSRGDSA
jgi:DNA polymerase-3 subunit gamma/tau